MRDGLPPCADMHLVSVANRARYGLGWSVDQMETPGSDMAPSPGEDGWRTTAAIWAEMHSLSWLSLLFETSSFCGFMMMMTTRGGRGKAEGTEPLMFCDLNEAVI